MLPTTTTIDDLVGLTPASMQIRPNVSLDAIDIMIDTPGDRCEAVLGIPAAIDVVLKLVGAIDRVQQARKHAAA
jgi:hypothetical protein